MDVPGVRAELAGRVDRLRASVPEGCRACGGWPTVRFLVDEEPELPATCSGCGREWHGLLQMFVIERVERGDADG